MISLAVTSSSVKTGKQERRTRNMKERLDVQEFSGNKGNRGFISNIDFVLVLCSSVHHRRKVNNNNNNFNNRDNISFKLSNFFPNLNLNQKTFYSEKIEP